MTRFLGLGGNELTHYLCNVDSSSGLQGCTPLHRGRAGRIFQRTGGWRDRANENLTSE